MQTDLLRTLVIGTAFFMFVVQAGATPAKAWEETVSLPTYKVAPPDKNPRFYSGRTYQGARATFYPYPVSDQMTELRENQDYKAVYLENDFIKISVLPELGGRIFTALDKGNNYDFFYRQHVIKPALIGMLGAWISGGVEWNIPHHHRASSFMPVDYALEPGKDGSKTLWVGETELRHRMKWMVGLTLRPDRSYIEMTVKVFNRTPQAQSFLFWINPAVHANTNYQVLFPPSTEWAVQHGKPEFAGWPIARQVYGGVDYTRGVDISWWKNHPSPVSFFAWHCEEDFFGGYDHGRKAGVVQISNHHVSPGKKFFEWGNGPEGEMWTKILSDEDGPYLELMAGSYSDNQPDYSWIQPGEVKVFKHYWYPIRELGGLKNANTEAAVELQVKDGSARVAFNTTSVYSKAKVLLKSADRVLLAKEITIGPNAPFATEVPLPAGVSVETLRASLSSSSGVELIAYQPVARADSPMPKPVKRPIAPKDVPSTEELYLTGLRIEQLYSPSFDPVPYYQEAIRRDPGDYRANTALGSLYCRQGRFKEAESHLRAAVERVTENYIRPKDADALYYLGVALVAQGKTREAREAFYQAIWSKAWQGAGYYALAELASAEGNPREALALAEQSIQSGQLNAKPQELKASLLRLSGRGKEAGAVASQLLEIDPLNHRALAELAFLKQGNKSLRAGDFKQLTQALRGEGTSYLELAMDYSNAGLYQNASEILELYASQVGASRVNPLAYYYLGYFQHKLRNAARSKEFYELGRRQTPDLCFPFQFEAERVLLHAMEVNPRDARAPYYLGNLLFDGQPLRAIELWEKSAELEPSFALAHRNLGFARAQAQKDVTGAVAEMEKAVALNPDDSRTYYELDVLYEAAGAPVTKRLEVLNRRTDVVSRRDDAVTRRIVLLTADGKLDDAMQLLLQRQFHNWEGSSSLHDVYVDASLHQGWKQLQEGRAAEALESFQNAGKYPANQQVGKPKRESRTVQISFCIGLAKQVAGKSEEAREDFKKASQGRDGGSTDTQFFRALALQATGDETAAAQIFADLEKRGLADLDKETEVVDYFAKFGEKRVERLRKADAHYAAGLGCAGLKKADEAERHFRAALELHPAHIGAVGYMRYGKIFEKRLNNSRPAGSN